MRHTQERNPSLSEQLGRDWRWIGSFLLDVLAQQAPDSAQGKVQQDGGLGRLDQAQSSFFREECRGPHLRNPRWFECAYH